jgi:outer membrane protein assembly factor BamD (BamD/ComL family)
MIFVGAQFGCQSIQQRPSSERKGLRGLFGGKHDNDWESELAEATDPLGPRAYNRMLLQDLSPSQIKTTWKVRTATKEDRAAAEKALALGHQLYERALAEMEQDPSGGAPKTFDLAANQFRLAAGKMPDSQVEHEALFFEGESYFFANRYVQSNRAFENLVSRYSGSEYLDKAEARRFAIAQYWLQLDEHGANFKIGDPARPKMSLATEARRILHRIRLDDPTGKLADDATLALANAYFKAGLWADAADTYEDLRLNYPGSRHQFHAHLFELKSRVNSYHGPSYDDEPLVKADKLLKSIVRQFPEQAREESEYLGKEGALIRHQLAERDWSMAEYFGNRGENRAAKIYYEKVAKQFADTNFADPAEKQISIVANEPAKPPQRAQWLVDLFPEPEAAKPVIAANPVNALIR